ncbi:MAG: phenylacetate--CoA ligase family protein [Oxalobacteraceae bacterium]|nr:phenylacetate--CoA ligase family protein [Oxalobacteraceae bacterium]
MSTLYDALESRDPSAREKDLLSALPALVARAKQASGWSAILKDIHPQDISSRAALAQLPVTRKSALKDIQKAALPFGGLNVTPVDKLSRIFMSPGPIFDPEGRGDDWWRYARPLHALGVRGGDLIQNCFAYHFTPAGLMVEGGAAKLGCPVIPAGIGQTEMQVQAMTLLRPKAYVGTPSFLKIIIEKAQEMGEDIRSVRYALVGAEALPPSLRTWLNEHGVPHVLQTYGSADIGNIAYETLKGDQVNPGMVLDETLMLEIVRPGTGEPVSDGEVGEVVITSFNPDYPLIRFATGDLSAVLTGISPCGRTNTRIKGWMGRADQTTKVRAMFVHPSQVADIVRRHPVILKARLVITGDMGNDEMTLHCEVADTTTASSHAETIVASIRDMTKLRGEVKFVGQGSLPNDGKVIDDARSYQ